tara:strand:+ start:69 stop:398 length:330 start_codon:yes stop_codon:yes gene_type:complete
MSNKEKNDEENMKQFKYPHHKKFDSKTKNGNSKVSCWNDEKNDTTPRDVDKNSKVKYWFKCDVCNHDFDETLYNITNKNKWCPYCTGKKICEDDECDLCYNNSFASLEE